MCCHAAIFRPTFEKYKSDIRNTWKTIKEILSKRGNKNASPTYLNVNGIEITTWKNINEILSKRGNKNASPTCLNENGIDITNTLEIANMFNNFFLQT